jgi:hypothetical protein
MRIAKSWKGNWMSKAELSKLKAQAKQATADARLNVQDEVDTLEKKIAALGDKLSEFKDAGEDAWESLRDGMEAAWDDLSKSVSKAWSKFK